MNMKIYKATNVTLLASGVILILQHQLQRREHLLCVINIDDIDEAGLTGAAIGEMLQPFDADLGDIIACQILKPIQFKSGEMFGYDGDVSKGMLAYMEPLAPESDTDADAYADADAEDEDSPIENARINELEEAIALLEDGNEAHWTNNGLPEVAALKEITGSKVTANERDAAWASYRVNNKE